MLLNYRVITVCMIFLCIGSAWGWHTDRANRPVDLWKYFQHGIVDYTATPIGFEGLFGSGQNGSAYLDAGETIALPYKTSTSAAMVLSGNQASFTFDNALPIAVSGYAGQSLRFYIWAKQTQGAARTVFTVLDGGGAVLATAEIVLLSTNCDAAATRPWYCDYVDIAIPAGAESIKLSLYNNKEDADNRDGSAYFSTLSWEPVTSTITYSTEEKQDPWTGSRSIESLDTPYYRKFGQENLRWGGYGYTQYTWNFWRGPSIGIYGVTDDMTTKAGIENWYKNVAYYDYEERNHGAMYVASRYHNGLQDGVLPPMEEGWLEFFADMIVADQDPCTGFWGWVGAPNSMAITFHMSDGLFHYYSTPRSDLADYYSPSRSMGEAYREHPRVPEIVATTLQLQATYVDDEGVTRWAAWPRKSYNWTSTPDALADNCWLASTSNAIWMTCRLSRWLDETQRAELYERVKAAVYYVLRYCVRDDGVWLQADVDTEPSSSSFMGHILEESDYLERRVTDLAVPSAEVEITPPEQLVFRWIDPVDDHNSLRIYAVPEGTAAEAIDESYLVGIIQRYGDKIYNKDPFIAVDTIREGAEAYWGVSFWRETSAYLGWKMNEVISWPLAMTENQEALTLTLGSWRHKEFYVAAATWYGEESVPVKLEGHIVEALDADLNKDGICDLEDFSRFAVQWQECLETKDAGNGCL